MKAAIDMNRRALIAIGLLLWAAAPAAADVLRVTDLNTTQIRALDRTKTLVVLSGGILKNTARTCPRTRTASSAID